jgi:hypothetical protein
MRRAGAEASTQGAAAGSPLWALSSVLLAGRLRMDVMWYQRESNSREEDDLIHWAKMKQTRYSFRYSGLFQFSVMFLQVL